MFWKVALTWLKNDPRVDSDPHPGVHQQGRLALEEPDLNVLHFFFGVHGPFSRARPVELLMILSRIWRPNCSGNGPWSSKKFCVPRAIPFKGDWNKLLKIKEAILNKGQMNWFASYLAISCCNKCSIFFVFIREPGQNVRCHKFGGPCVAN